MQGIKLYITDEVIGQTIQQLMSLISQPNPIIGCSCCFALAQIIKNVPSDQFLQISNFILSYINELFSSSFDIDFNYISILIFSLIIGLYFLFIKVFKKKLSSIQIILISAFL